jgi:hypothetical protein
VCYVTAAIVTQLITESLMQALDAGFHEQQAQSSRTNHTKTLCDFYLSSRLRIAAGRIGAGGHRRGFCPGS